MRLIRGRLLLLLVLLPLVGAALCWTSARAAGVSGSSPATTATLSTQKPGATPADSGEPDVGQTPKPLTPTGAISPAPDQQLTGPRGPAYGFWIRWIAWVWMVRYLGIR